MNSFLVFALFANSASALYNYCTTTGTSCTTSGTCSAGYSCLFRDSINKVCCPTAYRSCANLVAASTGVSTCAGQSAYCSNTYYVGLMQQQCPYTCGYCSSGTISTTSCVDLTNPSTGVSDCPSRAYLCTNPSYLTLMQTQCRRTCGYCSG
ncbi:unnamed protein product, partial [Mesorhabditis spiculigera]